MTEGKGMLMRRGGGVMLMAAGWAFGISSGGCSPKDGPGPSAPTVQQATGQATCSVAKDPLNPLIVEWPGTSRSALEATAQQGPVVVSYLGCVMKVLPDCHASGAGLYELARVTPSRETIAMADEAELRARLPLGVANLASELKVGSGLELSYVSVGQKQLAKPPTALSGQCGGATHYVRALTIGAYELNVTSRFEAAGGVEIGGTGVSGAGRSARSRLRGSGEVERCASGKASDGELAQSCGAVLQLGLVPIDAADGKVAAAGFGAGVGAVPVIPRVGELRELATGGGGLADVDVALLELLQAAKRADKGGAPARGKAAAWDALASYRGANPYLASAEQRRDQWTAVDEAGRKRHAQVRVMCAQRSRDEAKLARLLRLDEDVVPKRQREGYKREFDQVYAAWAADIPRCGSSAGEMITVAGGSLTTAARDAGLPASPPRRVEVDAFDLDAVEVTTAAYAVCVTGGGCEKPGSGDACNWGVSGRERHPINCVNWSQATAYCAWAGKRLPTEDEWEFAARGTASRTFPWGDVGPGKTAACWAADTPRPAATCEVGTHEADRTPEGVRDLAGNVGEWTSSGGRDPSGAGASGLRVVRGGSWGDGQTGDLLGARREGYPPSVQSRELGFRCAKARLSSARGSPSVSSRCDATAAHCCPGRHADAGGAAVVRPGRAVRSGGRDERPPPGRGGRHFPPLLLRRLARPPTPRDRGPPDAPPVCGEGAPGDPA